MKNIKFDYIFSSPLERAYETACIIRGSRDTEIVKDERLIEIGFGLYEGTVVEERKGSIALFFDDPQNYVEEKGAESYESLLARTKAFIENVLFPILFHSVSPCRIMYKIITIFPSYGQWMEESLHKKLQMD